MPVTLSGQAGPTLLPEILAPGNLSGSFNRGAAGQPGSQPALAPPTHGSGQSSADFQSAVSQNCILLKVRSRQAVKGIRCPADYKSAIQQIENLRYFVTGPCPPTSERAFPRSEEHTSELQSLR